jgi:hypothetical protein
MSKDSTNELVPIEINVETLKSKIYVIRGQRVMLDADLSEIYGYSTNQKTGGKFHDRYVILDYKSRSEKIYHCGASSKDAGKKITTISQADNRKLYYPMIEDLLKQPVLSLK